MKSRIPGPGSAPGPKIRGRFDDGRDRQRGKGRRQILDRRSVTRKTAQNKRGFSFVGVFIVIVRIERTVLLFIEADRRSAGIRIGVDSFEDRRVPTEAYRSSGWRWRTSCFPANARIIVIAIIGISASTPFVDQELEELGDAVGVSGNIADSRRDVNEATKINFVFLSSKFSIPSDGATRDMRG